MGLTATEREVYDYCEKNDFVSTETMEKFKKKLIQEGKVKTLSYAMEKFVSAACPKCKAGGAFKSHILGKLTHPGCDKSWYADPGTYMGSQLKAVFRTGRDMGGDMSLQAEKKGEKGYFELFFGFIMGAAFRLPFAIMMIPIQAVVSLSQKKD